MALIVDATTPVIDTTQIETGDVVYAKHRSWPEGRTGLVTGIRNDKLVIQFHPAIGNVMNHFFIPAQEVADGEWEVRWSSDLTEIYEVTQSEDGDGN